MPMKIGHDWYVASSPNRFLDAKSDIWIPGRGLPSGWYAAKSSFGPGPVGMPESAVSLDAGASRAKSGNACAREANTSVLRYS
jgi:hypothetical protein